MHYFPVFILGMKLNMFRTVPLSIIRSLALYTQQWYMSYRFDDSLRAGSGWNWSSISVHHQESSTVHTAMVYVTQVCWQLASRVRMELQFHPDPARKLSSNLYDIYHCCVYSARLL